MIGALANLHEFSSDKSIQHLTNVAVMDVSAVDVPQPALNEVTRVRSKSSLVLHME